MRFIRFVICIAVLFTSTVTFMENPVNYTALIGIGFWGTVLLTIFDC